MHLRLRQLSVFLTLGLATAMVCSPVFAQDQEEIIVRSSGSRETLKRVIVSLGGKINHEFQNLNAVAVSFPKTPCLPSIPSGNSRW